MAQTSFLLSTLLFGAFTVGVATMLVRGVDWRGYRPERQSTGPTGLVRLAGEPTVWMAGFFLMLAVFGGGALVAVGAVSLPAEVAAAVALVLVLAALLVVGGYTFYGTYTAARGRGRVSSMAAAQGVTVLSILFLVALVLKLVLVD